MAVGGPPRASIDADVLIVLLLLMLLGPVAGRRRRDARSAPQRAHVAEHEAALGPGRLGGARAPRGTHGTPLAAQSTQWTPARPERVEGGGRGGSRRSHYGTGRARARKHGSRCSRAPPARFHSGCCVHGTTEYNVHGEGSYSSSTSAQNPLAGGTPTTFQAWLHLRLLASRIRNTAE